MKDLQLMHLQQWILQEQFEEITHFGMDGDHFYFLADCMLFSFNSTEDIVQRLSDEKFQNIISFDILEFEGIIFIGTEALLHVLRKGENDVKTINLERRLEALCFNCTQDCAAMIFEDGSVGAYAFNYDILELYEQGVSHIGANVPQTVYVGWGSENTQFRGSEGKLKPEKSEVRVEPVTDTRPIISWRGNGEMFVINYWKEGKRLFKVFQVPCVPMYECETSPGLQPPIAWRPQGNMIACSVEVNSQNSIIIYEKNGYKRFSFPLQHVNQKVASIKWSPCAKVLAIEQNLGDDNTSLSLFTTSNYKWYLKQHLVFNTENSLKYYTWNNIISNCQSILTVVTSKHIVTYTFKSEVHRSSNSDHCAVIDGDQVLLTFFEKSKVPPPLYNTSIKASSPINFFCFHPTKQICTIIDASYEVALFSYNNDEPSEISRAKIKFEDGDIIPLSVNCFHWIDDQLYFYRNTDEKEMILYSLDVNNGDLNFINVFQDVLGIISVPQINSCVQIHPDKVILRKESSSEHLHNLDNIPLHFSAVVISDIVYTIILMVDNKLYINNNKICDQVTSFVVRGEYLLLTVTNNRLFCIRLTETQIDMLYKKELSREDFFSRNIEQGSLIVCANLNSPDVVLQMPRGNIETVCCYLIAIDILEDLLKSNKWSEALYFVRMQKLDWNLLIDLNPERFIDHIPKVVDACDTASALNCITIEIRDENVLNTRYSKWSTAQHAVLPNKRKVVCEKILEYSEEIDYAFAIQPIVFICIHHFSINMALKYLQDLLRRFSEDPNFSNVAADCVKLLKVYVLEDVLYNEALLMYDLELARYIAGFCQMDPKIYEPQLENLSKLSDVELRFEVNNLLGKYENAVLYLLRIPNKDPNFIKEYIKKHNVCKTAYEKCPRSSVYYKDVATQYAEFLSQKGFHQEAGIILVKAQQYNKAIEEYTLAMNWQQVVKIIQNTNFDDIEKKRTISNIASRLARNNKHAESGFVYDQYLGDFKTAINVLVEGHCFGEALRIASKHGQQNLSDNTIIPAVKEYSKLLSSRVTDISHKFHKYRNRLQVVRTLAVKQLTEAKDEEFDDDYGNRDSDLLSDTESRSSKRSKKSSGSRVSTLSSRNRRKEQRKMQDLKEGGVYEDIALVKALHDQYTEITSVTNEVKTTCTVLLEETDICLSDIRALHDSIVNLQKNMQDAIPVIWPECFFVNNPTKVLSEMAILRNIEFLDVKYRVPPSLPLPDWTLHIF